MLNLNKLGVCALIVTLALCGNAAFACGGEKAEPSSGVQSDASQGGNS